MSPRPPKTPPLKAWVAIVCGVGALSVAGVATAVVALSSAGSEESAPARAQGGTYAVAGVVPTSFGSVAVQTVRRLKGLTHADLSGNTHFPSYIGPDKIQLQAHVELTNLDDRRVARYSPTLFRLRVGTGPLQPPVSATFRPGELQPSATLRGDVIFIVPRRNASLAIEIVEPGVAGPRPVVDLGRIATPREGTVDALGHGHTAKVRNRKLASR